MSNRRRIRALAGAASAAVLALSLVACGGDKKSEGEGEEGPIVVGFVAVGPEGDWRAANEQNVKDTFTADKGFDLKYAPATKLDQQSQITAFNSFIDEEVDVILLSATEATGWGSTLQRAQEAGIPVILVDRGIEPDDTSLYVTRIAPDNVQVAKSVAEWAVKEFPNGANYVTLEGPTGVGVVNERNNGWDSVMNSHPEFKKLAAQTANWNAAEGKSVMETLLKAHNNDIQLVFAQNDEMGLGAALAVEEAGLTPGVDVKIATIDGTKNAMNALAEGRLSFVAEYNPLFGETLLEVVNKALKGEPVDSYIIVPSDTFDSPEAAKAALPNRKY